MTKITQQTAHRPWPLPTSPWILWQSWQHLLFAHWRIGVEQIRHLIPAKLDIETFDGSAWIGVVPFHLSICPRFLFPIPKLSKFPEINVRTYVRCGDRPGVWFFSLDASRLAACIAARRSFCLPYFWARMNMKREGDSVRYESSRRSADAQFRGTYEPISDVEFAEPGSLDHWLTERYCLYAQASDGRICRADVQHSPWPLQQATANIEINSMLKPLELQLPDEKPILHYSKRIDVVCWPLKVVNL